jgi:hypothetical protein
VRYSAFSHVRVPARKIDISAKVLCIAERQMFGYDAFAVRCAQRRERRAKIASRFVEFIDEEAVRHPAGIEIFDERPGLAHTIGIGVDHHDGGIGCDKRELDFLEKFDEAGAIDEGQVDVRGGRVGKSDAGRLAAIDAFGLVIGRARTVGHRTSPWDGSAAGEESFNQGRLARMMRTDDSDVSATGDVSH